MADTGDGLCRRRSPCLRKEKPRSIYGMIVADADRMIDPETIVRRTVQYGLANYPGP